jgi:hypothetical protein
MDLKGLTPPHSYSSTDRCSPCTLCSNHSGLFAILRKCCFFFPLCSFLHTVLFDKHLCFLPNSIPISHYPSPFLYWSDLLFLQRASLLLKSLPLWNFVLIFLVSCCFLCWAIAHTVLEGSVLPYQRTSWYGPCLASLFHHPWHCKTMPGLCTIHTNWTRKLEALLWSPYRIVFCI